MASIHFKKTLAVRFVAYLAILSGLGAILFEFGPVLASELNYRKDQLLGVRYTVATAIITSQGHEQPSSSTDQPTVSFGGLTSSSEKIIRPENTDYGITIEKINANAKVVASVNPGNETEYAQALKQGVAEALGSTKPGENGNLFIFSHSAGASIDIIRFNAIFYLLRELEKGDRVIIFYQNRRYDYLVFDKTITNPADVSFLTNRYDVPVLTLQTCDPPGTLLNRLIVRAKLQGS